MAQTHQSVRYDPTYRRIAYPGGDVPVDTGVCTDLVVRAYRALGIDLQLLVHEDMSKAFSVYPNVWGLTRPDANIDHRRVQNLETFFRRSRAELPVAKEPGPYLAGDLVTWMLPGNMPHIGIVALQHSGERPLIIHNIGRGPEVSDILFEYPIKGHYRYPRE
jgi:uncharacterized protein YijF (DUF1287 family)